MNQIGKAKQLTYLGTEKTKIATMDATRLTAMVSRWINIRIEAANEKDENERPTETALVAIKELEDYMDAQMAMFKSRGMNEQRAYRDAIIPTGEVFVNRLGEQVEKFRIVKRTESLEPVFEDDKDGEHGASIRASLKLPSEILIGRDDGRGKYNDGALIICQSACSIDHSEAMSM